MPSGNSLRLSGMLFIVLSALSFRSTSGIDDEYKGFIHFRNKDVTTDQVRVQHMADLLPPSSLCTGLLWSFAAASA
jgi:hypothetical protein